MTSGGLSDERVHGGLVLATADGHRLAFPAALVVNVEAYHRGGPGLREIPHAHLAFGQSRFPLEVGKVLMAETGDGVVVDTLEIHAEAVPLMAPPGITVGGVGGALRGFCTVGEKLWPVLRLAEFSRFLSGLESDGHPSTGSG